MGCLKLTYYENESPLKVVRENFLSEEKADVGAYRYGFNGKPTDRELNDWQDYGMRMYMKRLGRFPTPDPISKKYPYLSPYQFASNNPIMGIDLDGLEFANPQLLMRQQYPKLTAVTDATTEWAANTYNFFTHGAWQAETWKQAGSLIEEIALSSSPYSGIYNPNTPKLDAMVQGFENNVINGNTYTRTHALTTLGLDMLSGFVGDKGLSKLRALSFSTKLVRGGWVAESTAGWSANAIKYQEYVTGVKAGNALEVGGVRFDGVRGNTLLEAKSSYDNFVNKSGEFYGWFKGKDALLDQARRQLDATEGSPIEWNFSSQKSLDATQKLFNEAGIEGINLKYNPQQ
jgi:RHS repeat-associated protein